MSMPSAFEPILRAFAAVDSAWDEDSSTLALTFPMRYPDSDEVIIVFVSEDEEINGWQVDDGGAAAGLLEQAGVSPESPAITAYLQTVYAESVLMLDDQARLGIPVTEAGDLPSAVMEVFAATCAFYCVGRFGGQARQNAL